MYGKASQVPKLALSVIHTMAHLCTILYSYGTTAPHTVLQEPMVAKFMTHSFYARIHSKLMFTCSSIPFNGLFTCSETVTLRDVFPFPALFMPVWQMNFSEKCRRTKKTLVALFMFGLLSSIFFPL